MSIYELILYVCLLVSFFKETRNNNILIILLLCFMVCVAAFRSINVGTDTYNYYLEYIYMTDLQSLSDKSAGEYVFAFMTYIFRKYLSYDWYMLFWYICIIFSAGYVIMKSSVNKALSLFLFIACCFYTNSLNVMRQFVATCIMFMAMYEYSKEKFSRYKLIVMCIVCLFIHNASIILWPLFFMKKINISKKWQIALVGFSFVLGYFMSDYLQSIFVGLSIYVGRFEGYLLHESEGGRNFISNFGVNVMFVSTLLLANARIIESVYFKAYFISMILFNIVGSMYYMTRITDFYAVAQIICIPMVIRGINNKSLKKGYMFLLLVYCLSRFYIKGLYSYLPYEMRDTIFM